jgi:chromosome segregation ATPase
MKAGGEVFLKAVVLATILLFLAKPVPAIIAEEDTTSTSIPLGLEISASLKEVIIQHKEAISSYIMEIKTLTSKAVDERLRLIEEYHQQLKQRINLMNQERENLLRKLLNGTISPQEFSLEIRRIRIEAYGLSMLSDKLGRRLGEIGRSLSENLTTIADELVETNKLFSEQMRETIEQIKEELGIGTYRLGIGNTTDCKKLQSISNMLSKAKSRLEELREKLIEKIGNLRSNISRIDESLQQSPLVAGGCKELLKNLTLRLDILEKEIFNLNKTRSESLQKLSQLHEELNKFRQRQQEINQTINELENQLQRMDTERRELEGRLNANIGGDKEREKIRGRLQELFKEIDKLNERRREFNELMNEVRNRIEKHLKAIEELRNATQRFMEEIGKKIREREEVSRIIRELKEKCSGGNKTVIKTYITKSLLEKKLEFSEKELERLEMKIEILSNWLNETNDRISQFCQQTTQEKP